MQIAFASIILHGSTTADLIKLQKSSHILCGRIKAERNAGNARDMDMKHFAETVRVKNCNQQQTGFVKNDSISFDESAERVRVVRIFK